MARFSPKTIQAFCDIFDIPQWIVPWLHRFFEPEEIERVLDLTGGKRTSGRDRAFFTRCYRRGIIGTDDQGKWIPADFHDRFEIWALFEGWQDIPEDVRIRLNRWEMDFYLSKHRPAIHAALATGRRDPTYVWPEFVLPNEALAIIDRVPRVYQWPCNCRAMMNRCAKPGYVCLRFDNHRDLGWEISKERAGEILKSAHGSGLMHSAELALLPDGTIKGAICNCCSDCCFPQQLGNELSVEAVWPINRYAAVFSEDRCSTCGRCTKRCPYQAFALIPGEKNRNRSTDKSIHYDPALCRGCGLCASACPEGAIEMQSLAPSPLSIVSDLL